MSWLRTSPSTSIPSALDGRLAAEPLWIGPRTRGLLLPFKWGFVIAAAAAAEGETGGDGLGFCASIAMKGTSILLASTVPFNR